MGPVGRHQKHHTQRVQRAIDVTALTHDIGADLHALTKVVAAVETGKGQESAGEQVDATPYTGEKVNPGQNRPW